MKLSRALTNLFVCLVILALWILWLVPAACAWLEVRVFTPALGWCVVAIGKHGWMVGLLLIIPCGALLLLAAVAWLMGRLAEPLRDAMEKLNRG